MLGLLGLAGPALGAPSGAPGGGGPASSASGQATSGNPYATGGTISGSLTATQSGGGASLSFGGGIPWGLLLLLAVVAFVLFLLLKR